MGGSEEPHGVCACPGVCEVTETGWTTRKKEHLKDMEGPVKDVVETREWGQERPRTCRPAGTLEHTHLLSHQPSAGAERTVSKDVTR